MVFSFLKLQPEKIDLLYKMPIMSGWLYIWGYEAVVPQDKGFYVQYFGTFSCSIKKKHKNKKIYIYTGKTYQ